MAQTTHPHLMVRSKALSTGEIPRNEVGRCPTAWNKSHAIGGATVARTGEMSDIMLHLDLEELL
jgi:sugar phosphate permease